MNKILNVNCIEYMKTLPDKSVDFVLTDIPYEEVQRETQGLSQMKSLDSLGAADKGTFSLKELLLTLLIHTVYL